MFLLWWFFPSLLISWLAQAGRRDGNRRAGLQRSSTIVVQNGAIAKAIGIGPRGNLADLLLLARSWYNVVQIHSDSIAEITQQVRIMKNKSIWVLMLVLMFGLGGCGSSKDSAVEGKLVDWNGKPVGGVTITANQVQPLKGYAQLEAKTRSDGTFRLDGLFPGSRYVLKPQSDKWTSTTAVELDSAPAGETALLTEPIKIAEAVLKEGGIPVVDLATGATRFTVSADGVIADFTTGLEWVIGPDQDTSYAQAEQWVAGFGGAGGGWRLPTREELKGLYQPGTGERNMAPAFKTTGWLLWAEPRDASSAWAFNFKNGSEYWYYRDSSESNRVFAVRSRPKQ